jgi:hypothetical protein
MGQDEGEESSTRPEELNGEAWLTAEKREIRSR